MPSQNAIASKRNIRHRPLAFTEQGVAMLSEVLRNRRAIVDMHETDIRLLVQDVQKLKKRPEPMGPSIHPFFRIFHSHHPTERRYAQRR